MPEQPLRVSLEATDHRPDQFTLISNSSQYSITLNPETNVTFSEWLRRLQPVLTGQSDPAGEVAPQELLHDVGTWLWQALLPDRAPIQERDSLAQALRKGRTPLLLALPDALVGLPWELLCDPQQPAEQGFLARRRPFMRLVATDTSIAPVTPPLRVLLLISSPPGLEEDSRVDVESERAAVEQATHEMREAGLLHLLVEDIVTPKRVQQALVRFKPHLLHYIGHEGFDEKAGGVLLWEDDQGNELPLSAARLANLLRPRNLHAVVLHACQTGRSNTRTDMRSMADTLLHEGIPAVIAQQTNFSYESSQRASEAWYTALTAGQGFAQALFEVRQALSQADRPDWAVPILQGSAASLVPVLDDTALPGPLDPLLARQGAAADLPAPTGVFVGRHRELRELRLMLEHIPGSGPVLALITGPGGVGKSSLAALAAARSGGKYKGALTLSCLGYQSVELFLRRIGEFLKRLEAPNFLEQTLPDPKLSTEAKIEEAIAALNSVGPVLLIVDNLESAQTEDQTLRDASLLHLLQKLLTNLRGGRVLITGRYAVKDLLPQGKFATHLLPLNLDDLSPYETTQLLTRHPTLAHLGETVRQTLMYEFGGLPYVYDLLSSDAASQSLDLLVHDVQNRITQERKERRAEEWQAVRRQVVEFAALASTISRLSESSRTLLARLAVLHQSFPLAAIEQGLGADCAAWQPLLAWSLLRYDQSEQTYRLHSITRHYAENLLDEQDRGQAQIQLAAWYEHYEDRESHSLADYLEAHRLYRAAGSIQQAGELVIRRASKFIDLGLYSLLRELCTITLHDIRESNEQLAIYALNYLGMIAKQQGGYEVARQYFQQCLPIAERLGDQTMWLMALEAMGMVALEQGDYEVARQYFQQCLEIAEQLGDQHQQATSLYALGALAGRQQEYAVARQFYQQSLVIHKRLGDLSWQASTLHGLYGNALLQGHYKEAWEFSKENLAIAKRQGDPRKQARILEELGMSAFNHGDDDQARRFNQQSLAINERLGDQLGQAIVLDQLGIIAQFQGDYKEALRLYQQSLEIKERFGDQLGRAKTLEELGNIAYKQGDYEAAGQFLKKSLEIKEQLENQHGQATTLRQLGMIAFKQGKHEQARQFYQKSLAVGDQYERAETLEELGNIAYEQGDYEQALTYTVQAYILLDPAPSPVRKILLSMLARIRSQMDEATFTILWQKTACGRPLPLLPELSENQQQREAFLTELSILGSEVVKTLCANDVKQQEVLATRLEQMLKNDFPVEGTHDFLQLLVGWLRGQDTHTLEERLQHPFQVAYSAMVAYVEQKEIENTDKDDSIG